LSLKTKQKSSVRTLKILNVIKSQCFAFIILVYTLLCSFFRMLSSEFTVQFGEILSIKILQWPESIRLQVRYYDIFSFIRTL